MEVKETKKPTSFREWLAMKLVRLAQWIYPKSEAVLAFYTQLIHDEMIYGQAITRVDPETMYIANDKGIWESKRGKKPRKVSTR